MEETLADKIVNFRAEKSLTQKQLAKKIGIAEGTIVSAENGRNLWKVNKIKILNYIEKNK